MTLSEFKELCDNRIAHCMNIMLGEKNEEYARGGDKLHNFKVAGRYDNESPDRALWGMLKKHLVSIQDIINDVDGGGVCPSREMVDAKVSDYINYGLLLEGLLHERREGGDKHAVKDRIEQEYDLKEHFYGDQVGQG